MSANVTVQGLDALYGAVVEAFGNDAPEEIAVVADSGEMTVYRPPA